MKKIILLLTIILISSMAFGVTSSTSRNQNITNSQYTAFIIDQKLDAKTTLTKENLREIMRYDFKKDKWSSIKNDSLGIIGDNFTTTNNELIFIKSKNTTQKIKIKTKAMFSNYLDIEKGYNLLTITSPMTKTLVIPSTLEIYKSTTKNPKNLEKVTTLELGKTYLIKSTESFLWIIPYGTEKITTLSGN